MTLSARQLDHALARGDLDTVKAELDRGALDLQQPLVRYGMLPLHNAAWHGHAALVSLLVQYGADPEGRSDEGLTALLLACEQAHWATASTLMTLGAQADARDHGGNQAVHFAAERPGGELLLAPLLARGVAVDARNAHGWTAMHVAARSGQVTMVHALAEAKADLNARDQEGHTPLLLAARDRRIEVLWALHTLGVDETARNHLKEGIGDIVDPLLFEQLGRDHEVYWWLRPLMPVQKRWQVELRVEADSTPDRLRTGRSTP
jgi:ankyrin repeat protein